MENISGFFVVFKEVDNDKLQSISPAVIDIKFSRQKIISKERTVIKITLKTFLYSFVVLRRSRYIFNRHKLPARANDTKREAVWYSELYLFEKGVKNYFYGGDELRPI